jgi:hypothetical protein
MKNKQSHHYLSFIDGFTKAPTEGVKEIPMIVILNNNIKNDRAYGKISHVKNPWAVCPHKPEIKIKDGKAKINKDTSKRANPFIIANLLSFFIEYQIFNDNKPKAIQIKNIINKNSIINSLLRKIIEIIDSKKNIHPNNNHNHINIVIAIGFLFLLSSPTYEVSIQRY